MALTEAQKEYQRAYAKANPEKMREKHRKRMESLKARGLKRVLSEDAMEHKRQYLREKYAEKKANGTQSEWAKANPEKHRENTRRWREENRDQSRLLSRKARAKLVSSPWGKIDNSLFALMNAELKRFPTSTTINGKYTSVFGYSWDDMKNHITNHLTPEMAWDNWGTVWEIDHIIPRSHFRYESIEDPKFKEAWALSNLRPLLKHENASKGSKHIV